MFEKSLLAKGFLKNRYFRRNKKHSKRKPRALVGCSVREESRLRRSASRITEHVIGRFSNVTRYYVVVDDAPAKQCCLQIHYSVCVGDRLMKGFSLPVLS